ncbi:unnamed protein product [Chironomus riparius]|uniref:H15 domain-containing protein n=1 Tax=Chironomus riparius TaxID=315576 RepID=A0A9N9WML8_9DIPT|nr:unnamed protein product [Chironomus riparius]
MAEEQVETAVAAPKSLKRSPQYSKTGKLVMDAILNLNERKGSSIMKIRNYIASKNPEIDMTRYGRLIKKFIVSAAENGELKNSEDSKGSRGFFKIVAENKKKVKKLVEKSSADEKVPTQKKKGSKNAPSPKVKKPVSKTVKLPSVVATIKKKKTAKANPVEAEKESATKTKKKATASKRTKKSEDEVPAVPKKTAKKDSKEVEKPKVKPKKAKAAKTKEVETDEKVPKGKKKKAEAEKSEKVAAKKKKKEVKVDDENKEE